MKYDIVNNNIVETFNLKEEPAVIDNNFGQNYIYYLSIHRNSKDIEFIIYQIDFEKMDCEEVFKFNRFHPHINSLEQTEIDRAEIIGINERYFIFAVPDFDSTKNINDSGHFLIDIKEQQIYKIPKFIGSKDYINNLSYIRVFEISGEYHIMLVTGRISSWEKRKLWDTEKTGTLPRRTKFQSISLLPLNTFIKIIKYNQSIDKEYIIYEFDEHSALAHTEILESNIYIYKEDFKNNNSQLYINNIESKKIDIIEIEEIYNKIFFIKGKPRYGLKKLDTRDVLHDFNSGEQVFSTNEIENISWVYKNIVITREYSSLEGRVIFKLNDLEKEEVITEKKGRMPGVYYSAEHNTLVLF
ncbi:hypothetical protein [Paenibacillus amylolyticus]